MRIRDWDAMEWTMFISISLLCGSLSLFMVMFSIWVGVEMYQSIQNSKPTARSEVKIQAEFQPGGKQ